MELVFVKRESTLQLNGIVKDIIGAGGRIEFIPKNLADNTKRVAVVLKRADGTSLLMSCSETVSDEIRRGNMTAAHVLGLPVVNGEQNIPFISMPEGVGNVGVNVDEVAVKKYEPKAISATELFAILN
jgi:hypothetical protein